MRRLLSLRLGLVSAMTMGAAVYFSWSCIEIMSHRRFLRDAEEQKSRNMALADLTPTPTEGPEAGVARAALGARVRRVVSVTAGDRTSGEKSIEWESDLPSALAFLRDLEKSGAVGGLAQFSVSAVEQEPGLLRGRASFSPRVPCHAVVMTVNSGRDIFRPLWRSGARPAVAATAQLRRQEEQRRREAEKIEADRRVQADAQALDNKKKEFETRYTLTGIANNGRENIAFVDSGGANRQTVMLKNGDQLEEARVQSINEKNGEMKLDYQGRFSVVLKLGSAPRSF